MWPHAPDKAAIRSILGEVRGRGKSLFLTLTEIACVIAILRATVRIAAPVTEIAILVMTVIDISERYKNGNCTATARIMHSSSCDITNNSTRPEPITIV